jgi:ABC-type sugar transport system ATPase subunit
MRHRREEGMSIQHLAPGSTIGAHPAGGRRYRARDISKRFGPITVLQGVDVTLQAGRVLTIMGENGAGKSTMFKILAGQLRPTGGRLELDGQELALGSPSAAHAHGIYLVPQEPMLMPELSVAEMMFVGHMPTRGRLLKRVDWREIRGRTRAVLDALELDIDIDRPAKSLSIAQLQLVECAKALLHNCRIILFDEPTSPLTTHEVDTLFGIMRRLAGDGYALSFISHRTEEVMEISDDIVVLRDGRLVGTADRDAFDRASLLSLMVGRELRTVPRRTTSHTTDEVALAVTGLTHEPSFRDVDFSLRRGEILGFAGLIGAGRTEIAETIFGLRRVDDGKVVLEGEDITGASNHDLIRRGVAYVPEDRGRHGAVLPMTITENITSGLMERVRQTAGLMSRSHETEIGAKAVRDFRIRCAGLDQTLLELSGGNQQKVVFAKWVSTGPRLAILDEPTRGVDVGAKEEIYELIDQMAAAGTAVVVISSEAEELVRLCDRVLCIYEGRIVAELSGAEITPQSVSASYVGGAAERDAEVEGAKA